MARTRTTIRRIDPWSILKFAFVANIVLLGIELLVGAIAWAMIRRLGLIETICDLAGKLGINECGIDGQQLFDTVLVLGLLGVVIQTGIFVFLSFLANLIFDLVGGIGITLDDTTTDGPSDGTVTARSKTRSSGTKTKSTGSSKPKVSAKPSAKASTAGSKLGAKLGSKTSSGSESATSTGSGTGTGSGTDADSSGYQMPTSSDAGPRSDDPLFGGS